MAYESFLPKLHHPDRRVRKQARKEAMKGEEVIRESGRRYKELNRALNAHNDERLSPSSNEVRT